MKKIIIGLAALLSANLATGFAAPINDLHQGQTAVGVVMNSGDNDSDTFYLEHKLSNNFTLGLQNSDFDYGGDADDIYGQFNLNNNLRAIVGNRDYGYDSKFYMGLAATTPLAPAWDGYASLIGNSDFKELQVGANYQLARNVDFNLNYRSNMPDQGSNNNGLGFGATLKL
ncbi:hypothetical protein SDC9_128611 [bioreactor metagenome]|uniref:Porin domain-containing protein n=1 Tax=bioreactor metagenome TaxID=1076179 RepID=A0A645CXC3_9ZZZZ